MSQFRSKILKLSEKRIIIHLLPLKLFFEFICTCFCKHGSSMKVTCFYRSFSLYWWRDMLCQWKVFRVSTQLIQVMTVFHIRKIVLPSYNRKEIYCHSPTLIKVSAPIHHTPYTFDSTFPKNRVQQDCKKASINSRMKTNKNIGTKEKNDYNFKS